jgi:hypothetical protein
MLFPLNNDTLILFLEKKLFCAGNENEEKAEVSWFVCRRQSMKQQLVKLQREPNSSKEAG